MARNGPKDTASSYPGSSACCSIPPPGLIDPAIHRVSALLVLVLPAGYCGCHSPMAVAMLCLGGHRVGIVLPKLVGRDKGEMLGLEVGMEPVSCCVWPCRAAKPVVDSSCSNMAVHMTELVFPLTDGFRGRSVVSLRKGRCLPHPAQSFTKTFIFTVLN